MVLIQYNTEIVQGFCRHKFVSDKNLHWSYIHLEVNDQNQWSPIDDEDTLIVSIS
jgi:hypothetical protein